MALQSTQELQLIQWPGVAAYYLNNWGFGARTSLDAAGEYHAFVIPALEDMEISHAYFQPHAVSGSPTADIRIETVDPDTGLPTGTLWDTGTNVVTGTLTTTGAVHALGATASISRGEWFALKIAYNSGTSFSTQELIGQVRRDWAYSAINTGTPTKGAFVNHCVGLGSSSSNFYRLPSQLWPVTGQSTGNITNGNGARWGLRFKLPFKATVHALISTVSNDHDFQIYDDAGNAISGASGTVDTSQQNSNHMLLDTPTDLDADTWYRAVVVAGAGNFFIRNWTAPSADLLSGFPGGLNAHRTDYTTSGGWTTTDTQVPALDLIISRLEDGAGSGGGTRQKVYGG